MQKIAIHGAGVKNPQPLLSADIEQLVRDLRENGHHVSITSAVDSATLVRGGRLVMLPLCANDADIAFVRRNCHLPSLSLMAGGAA